MSATTELWAAVVTSYDSAGLVTLTNIRDRAATTINTTAGEDAAGDVINLWPIYAQVDYDSTDAKHVAVGKLGVIALLWRRGGSASAIEQVKWDEVFGDEGMISRLKRTGPRGHAAPSTNSAVQQSLESTTDGRQVRGWSDPDAIPNGLLPLRRTVDY